METLPNSGPSEKRIRVFVTSAGLLDFLVEGRIAPVVAEVLPLSEVQEAPSRVGSGLVAGKPVLRGSEA